MKKWTPVKEIENYEYLCDKIQNEDYQKRVKYSFIYYIRNANFYKYLGMTLSILGIVMPAFATVLTVCGAHTGWITFATASATAASGLFAYLKCADKQATYRKAAENMKAELVAYAAGQGVYKTEEGKETDKDTLLFERIEPIIQNGYEKIAALERKGMESGN